MCAFFEVSKSGYYDFAKRMDKPEHDEALAREIAECRQRTRGTYGYRRVQIWLLKEKGIYRNPKTVLRIMQKYGLLSEIRRRRKYKYMGQQIHRYENLFNRDFSASRPNQKWVTDISYIHTGQGVLFLSMIRDLYDNSIIAYKTGTEQTVNLVLSTVKAAKEKEAVTAELQLHSDQGFQYTSRGYFNLTKSYNITPSMSRRGNCLDNAPAENFFGILKSECINRQKIKDFAMAKSLIEDYIYFYNHERIQTKSKLTPFEKRRQSA
jgi:transposase InsO family protein